MEFKKIQKLVYKEYVDNGFYSEWEHVVPSIAGKIAEIGLFAEEVGEGLSAIRHGNKPLTCPYCKKIIEKRNIEDECADIVIRVMNFCTRTGIDLEKAILKKNNINTKRDNLHGKQI